MDLFWWSDGFWWYCLITQVEKSCKIGQESAQSYKISQDVADGLIRFLSLARIMQWWLVILTRSCCRLSCKMVLQDYLTGFPNRIKTVGCLLYYYSVSSTIALADPACHVLWVSWNRHAVLIGVGVDIHKFCLESELEPESLKMSTPQSGAVESESMTESAVLSGVGGDK